MMLFACLSLHGHVRATACATPNFVCMTAVLVLKEAELFKNACPP